MNDENHPEENQTGKHMASVKAPEGRKQSTAMKHYQASEKARKADNDEEAHNDFKQASRALI